MSKRVVVTGVGLLCPLGLDTNECWQGLLEGRNGIGTIQSFDATLYNSRIAGEVRSILAGQPADAIREVGSFWLNHHNVQPGNWPRQRAKDAARKSRESAAFRELAGE